MRLIQSALLGLAVFVLAAGSVRADDKSILEKAKTDISNASRSDDSTFAELDRNRNGYISKAEAAADPVLAKEFDKFDWNHDGRLNRAEYLAARGKEDTRSVAKKITGKDEAKEPGSISK
jgi:Ca2+-binding EF-hand superfamily protein